MNKQMLMKVSSIGKVISIDFESLMAWRLNYGHKTFELAKDFEFEEKRNQFLNTDINANYFTGTNISIVESFQHPFYLSESTEEEVRERFEEFVSKKISILENAFKYASKFDNPIQVYFVDDKFVIIGWGETRTLIPREFV